MKQLMIRNTVLFFILTAVWLLLAPEHDIILNFLGVLSSLATVAWVHYRNLLPANFHIILAKVFMYFPLLILDMLKANVQIIKLILSIKPNIHPVVISAKSLSSESWKHILWANAITFTPGTVAYDVNSDGIVRIYALNNNFSSGLTDETSGQNYIISKL